MAAPSRDNPAAEGCHMTIPPPGVTEAGTGEYWRESKTPRKLHSTGEVVGRPQGTGNWWSDPTGEVVRGLRALATGGALQDGPQGP